MTTHRFRKTLPTIAAGFLAATAGHAAADKSADKAPPLRGNDCVFFQSVYDWQELDQNNLVIWGPGRHHAYQVYFAMPLPHLQSSWQLAFIDKDGDGRLCGFGRDEIAVANLPQQATITAVKRLDAEGIAKLEEQFKTSLKRDSKKKRPKSPAPETAN